MLFNMRASLKYGVYFLVLLMLTTTQSLHAQGPPVPSSLENPLVIGFIILMLILLLVVGLLANLLLGVAQVKMKKEKESIAAKIVIPAVILFLFFASPVVAQDRTMTAAATIVPAGIAGVSTTAFYLMTAVIFVELLVIFLLLIHVRTLLKVEKEKVEQASQAILLNVKLGRLWEKLNSFKSPEQEADIDLGHDYDGIRELDNRLPPWWLYGFYLTIIVACVYFYRFQISHTGPSGVQEYETSVAKADIEIKEYLLKKGDLVDENTVTVLTAADEIEAGKSIFVKSCVACHNEGGAGNVGPNLTDDYWLHGGDIKSIFKTIRYGVNAMPQWQNSFSNKQIAELASYVKSLKGTKPANPKAPQGILYNEDDKGTKTTAQVSIGVNSALKSHSNNPHHE
ncbi:MAG: cbb3-type cytochrome c oxidase N-terminal domain-containing protein [Bacteroidota bacterium]